MIFYIIAVILCTLYLATRKEEKYNIWQILWVIVSFFGGIVSAVANKNDWNKTTVTHWVVQGPVVSSPERNLVFYILAWAMLCMVITYVLSRGLNAVIGSVQAKSERDSKPLVHGEKRRKGTLLNPVCYCCNKPKSIWNGYPSKICGQRICFDCLKELEFDSLFNTDEHLAAYAGKAPFLTADDVIAELRRRKAGKNNLKVL